MGFKFAQSLLTQAKNNQLAAKDYDGYAVTPDDSNDLGNGPTKALYITGAGNVNLNLPGAGGGTLASIGAGQLVPIAASRVLSTGTTATGIFALY